MVVKTFRGLLADGGQDRIRLSTIKGKVGYRISKFQVVSYEPMSISSKCVVKIYTSEQTLPTTATINFTDSDLLGMGIFSTSVNADTYPEDMTIIFDYSIFNQDIYITHQNKTGSGSCNYYLELEVIPLDDAGAEYTTLKDMRQ